MQKKILLIVAVVIILVLSYKFLPFPCNCSPKSPEVDSLGYRTEQINLGSTPLTVEVSDTTALEAQGLSGRDSLPPDTGMLFAFAKPDTYGFWMKDMKFSLDLIWIDPNMQIIKIDQNLAPDTYPQAFLPPAPVEYVVEVPAGFAQGHSLKVGQNLSIGQ
jgi:uncharacterized protein